MPTYTTISKLKTAGIDPSIISECAVADGDKLWLDEPCRVTLLAIMRSRAAPERTKGERRGEVAWGPAKWAELHRWAMKGDLPTASRWLDSFAASLPCGECKQHWLNLVRDNPPDFGSNEALFDFTVGLHNMVNISLGKPQMTLDEAARRWSE